MLIRIATPNDASSLAFVEVITWRTAYRDLLPKSFLQSLTANNKAIEWRENLLKHQISRQKRVLVAIDDQEQVVGFVRVGTIQEEGSIGLVYAIYVLPTHWECGVGTALMRAAMHELTDLGHTRAILWVLRDNIRARHFYERMGWQLDGQTTDVTYGDVSLQALRYSISTRHSD